MFLISTQNSRSASPAPLRRRRISSSFLIMACMWLRNHGSMPVNSYNRDTVKPARKAAPKVQSRSERGHFNRSSSNASRSSSPAAATSAGSSKP